MKQRVVLLRSNPVSPDPAVEKIAEALASEYKVTVIGWDRNGTERYTDGFLKPNSPIRIVRFGISAEYGGGLRKNLIPMIRFRRRLFAWLRQNRNEYDIIHAFDFDTGSVAKKIAKRYKKALIYHILDFYADAHAIAAPLLKRAVTRAEYSVIESANATVICTEQRKEQIRGSHPKRLEVIHNTPKEPTDLLPLSLPETGRCKIVYVGILAEERYLREMLRFVLNDERFELHIGGFGALEKEIADAAAHCNRIVFYGTLPYEKTLALERACDVITALYDPSIPNHAYAAPNKFYEALLLGKPLIAVRNTGFDNVIESENIGAVTDGTARGIAAGFDAILRQKGEWERIKKTMHRLYRDRYGWNEMQRRLLRLYHEICDEKDPDCQQ